MSWDFATTTNQIATKDYMCEACDWIYDNIHENVFSFADFRLIVNAKRDGWKIKTGQKYVKVSGKWDGEWCVFRARPQMNKLCQDLDLYRE